MFLETHGFAFLTTASGSFSTSVTSYIVRTEHVVSLICGCALLAISVPIGTIIAMEILAFVFRVLAEYKDRVLQNFNHVVAERAGMLWVNPLEWNRCSVPLRAWTKMYLFGGENNRL